MVSCECVFKLLGEHITSHNIMRYKHARRTGYKMHFSIATYIFLFCFFFFSLSLYIIRIVSVFLSLFFSHATSDMSEENQIGETMLQWLSLIWNFFLYGEGKMVHTQIVLQCGMWSLLFYFR